MKQKENFKTDHEGQPNFVLGRQTGEAFMINHGTIKIVILYSRPTALWLVKNQHYENMSKFMLLGKNNIMLLIIYLNQNSGHNIMLLIFRVNSSLLNSPPKQP